ncbi:hypothetical protein R84B8_00203 [Treponema sp. R8-4-B8]
MEKLTLLSDFQHIIPHRGGGGGETCPPFKGCKWTKTKPPGPEQRTPEEKKGGGFTPPGPSSPPKGCGPFIQQAPS